MTTAIEITESVQTGILRAVETGQRWTADAVKAMAATVDGLAPDRATMPFAEAMPTMREVVDSGFEFVERLLAAQHSFMSELAGLAVTPGGGAPTNGTPASRPKPTSSPSAT